MPTIARRRRFIEHRVLVCIATIAADGEAPASLSRVASKERVQRELAQCRRIAPEHPLDSVQLRAAAHPARSKAPTS